MKIILNLIIALSVFLSNSVFAKEIVFSSKDKQATFVELFTSQGCSSCPPAEEYINKYIVNKDLWSKYIPIVFHVDYWDYIGWKDVFAKPQFTSRQYRYAKLKHVRTVYTPAYIVNGKAWRRGFFNSYPNGKGLDSGILDVTVTGDSVKATFNSKGSMRKDLNLNIAILGMDMTIDITSGENEGRKSKHNFVVLGHTKNISSSASWNMKLPTFNTQMSSRFAFVAWLSLKGDPTPIQAVGGWMPADKY